MLQSLFNPTTALHVSGVTITHLQEHKSNINHHHHHHHHHQGSGPENVYKNYETSKYI